MKILIAGNMGDAGPRPVKHLRTTYPDNALIGLDLGYYANCLTNGNMLPECRMDTQYYADNGKLIK